MKDKKSHNNIERRFYLDIRAADPDSSDSRELIGYAAVFNRWSENLGWFKEIIHPGAFTNALRTSDVRALFNHDPNHLLARTKSGTLKLWEDETGLGFRFELPDHRQDLYELVKRGDLSQNSFAFTIKEQEWVEREGEITERHIKEVERVYDVSPVTYPAYPDTTLALRSFNQHKGIDIALPIPGVRDIQTKINEDGSYTITVPASQPKKRQKIDALIFDMKDIKTDPLTDDQRDAATSALFEKMDQDQKLKNEQQAMRRKRALRLMELNHI